MHLKPLWLATESPLAPKVIAMCCAMMWIALFIFQGGHAWPQTSIPPFNHNIHDDQRRDGEDSVVCRGPPGQPAALRANKEDGDGYALPSAAENWTWAIAGARRDRGNEAPPWQRLLHAGQLRLAFVDKGQVTKFADILLYRVKRMRDKKGWKTWSRRH